MTRSLTLMFNAKVTRQLLRYAAVGIAINSLGYSVYLLITYLGLPSKVAMTVLYCAGALAGYVSHREITFSYSAGKLGSGFRYLLAHGAGYLLNMALLVVFVDVLAYPHQWVQAASVFIVAAFLFLAFKLFVFRTKD